MIHSVIERLKKKYDWRRARSIRYTLILSNSVLIGLMVFIIVCVNLLIVTNLLTKNVSYFAQQTITQTNNKIDSALQRIEFTSRISTFNPENQTIIREKKNARALKIPETRFKTYQREQKLNGVLNDIVMAVPELYSVAIYFDKENYYGFNYFGNNLGNYVNSQRDYNMNPIEGEFDQLDDVKKNIIWMPTYDLTNKIHLFTMARSIVDSNSFNRLGILVLSIESKFIDDSLSEKQLGDSGKLYFVNKDGVVISSNEENIIGKKLQLPYINKVMTGDEDTFIIKSEGKSLLVAYKSSLETGLRLVGIVPLGELTKEILNKQTILIGIGIIGLILSVIMSVILASLITKPINNLRKAMKEVEKGQLTVDVKDSMFVETKELDYGFKVMLQKLDQLLIEVYEKELRKKEAEFKALQAQINPHFLYNTLETINYMLLIDEKYEISKLVTTLGDILRYSLSKGGEIISLNKDMEQIENYLFIQKTRFGDSLNIELGIEPETTNCLILKLLIQPLVENAIVHGIEMKRGAGTLRIQSEIQDDKLLISVEDNGIGMTKEEINNSLIDDLKGETNGMHTKLGISNVNRRIKIYYGEDYGLEVKSEKNKGTCIHILLPVIKEDLIYDEDTNCG